MESGGDGEKFSDTFDGAKKDCLKEVHRYNSISMAKTGQRERGEITVIAAPMYAGKSSRLIAEAERFSRAGWNLLVVKHPLDVRYAGVSSINSHDGRAVECQAIADLEAIYQQATDTEAEVVMIDEAQFYMDQDELFVAMVEALADRGVIVILAGLELDFRGEVFGPMAKLMAHADRVEKLTAVCKVCGDMEANRTQRLVNGEPANYNDPIVMVGAQEAYEARCAKCHKVPGKPTFEELLGIEKK